MGVLQSLRSGSSIDRRHAAVVLLAVLVGLAGCGGLGGGGGEPTATGTPTPTATATPTETAPATPTQTADGATEPSVEPVDVSAETVVGETVASVTDVESYAFAGTLDQTVRAPNREQNISIQLNTSVDRASQRLAAAQTTETAIQTVTSNVYIVNGTLYQRSQQLVAQYNSEWIKIDVSSAVEDQFNRNDELAAHRVILQNATVESIGAQDVDGQRAYRLDLDADESALASFYGFNGSTIEIQSVDTTVWVSTETSRILRAAGEIRQQVTVQGQELSIRSTYDERFRYTDVDITLPAAASSAVEVNQTTGLAT